MRKSDSKPNKETVEEELERLRKENTILKSKNSVYKTENKDLKKELKKKGVTTVSITDEQRKLLSTLFPDIDTLL